MDAEELCFGPHVNRYHAAGRRPALGRHVEAAVAEAAAAGVRLGAVAVFLSAPKSAEMTADLAEREDLRRTAERCRLRVFAHSSYVANPWMAKGDDPELGRAFVLRELYACRDAGAEGLVVHLPSAPPSQVAHDLRRLCADAGGRLPARLFLEVPATVPAHSFYETPAKITALFDALRANVDPGLETLGLCVDTAHLWTSGVDLQSYGAAENWLTNLEAAAIPPKGLLFHLNDSARPRGHGPDTHAGLAQGNIWKPFADDLPVSGLAAVVDFARRLGVPAILERKPKEALADDYAVLRALKK